MRITQLAEKQFRIIFGDAKCREEEKFIRKYVLNKEPTITWCSGIQLLQVHEFCQRVHAYKGRVLGLQTSLNSPHPLSCFPWENFCLEYDPEWVISALETLQKNKIERFIVPTVDFDIKTLIAFR